MAAVERVWLFDRFRYPQVRSEGATASRGAPPGARVIEEGRSSVDDDDYRTVAVLCELPPDGFRWRKYGRKIVGSQGGVECVRVVVTCLLF